MWYSRPSLRPLQFLKRRVAPFLPNHSRQAPPDATAGDNPHFAICLNFKRTTIAACPKQTLCKLYTRVSHSQRRSRMTRRLLTALAVLFAISLAAPSIGHAQAFKVEKFDIKGEGGTDYVAVEAATGRVFVSRANHMMVIEGATGKVLGDIPNTPGVHGAGIASKAGHGFTTNGGDETVTMFDLKKIGRGHV